MSGRLMAFALAGASDKNVHLHIEERDAHGHFQHSRTHILGGPESGHDQVTEIYLHDGMQLVVHEAAGDVPTPTHGTPGHGRLIAPDEKELPSAPAAPAEKVDQA